MITTVAEDIRIRTCTEFGFVRVQPEEIQNADGTFDISPSVRNMNAFSIDVQNGEIRLQAGGFVGLIPVNSRLVLRVTPRTPISNLTRMVERSGYEPFALTALTGYATATAPSDWLMDVYADALIQRVEGLLNSGLLRTYRQRTAAGSSPRGRIDIGPTMRNFAARGIDFKAQYSWHERSADNPANRAIKAALLLLHQRYIYQRQNVAGSHARVKKISNILDSFEDVSADSAGSYLSDLMVRGVIEPPPSRAYYAEPLKLVVAILQNQGVSFDSIGTDVTLPSVLLDMGDLFELYVRSSLRSYAATEGWPVEVLDGNKEGYLTLYEGIKDRILIGSQELLPIAPHLPKPPSVTPDIVLRRPDGSIPLVGEVKNTKTKELPGRSEVEQAVTYAVRYDCDRVLLIHPRLNGHVAGLQFAGQIGRVKIFDYRYDLAAADVDVEDAAFAKSVRGLLAIS